MGYIHVMTLKKLGIFLFALIVARAQAPVGTITTIAGGWIGDGGAAVDAAFANPWGVAVMAEGSILIADRGNHRIRRVAPDGTISTVAGTGNSGFSGDGGAATDARLNFPSGLAVTRDGSILIADTENNRIRMVTPDGKISTVAGTTLGYGGDGGPAASAKLSLPNGVAVTVDGSILIADTANQRIRRIASNGTITTVAGTGTRGFSGDAGPAVASRLNSPSGVVTGQDGSILIADTLNYRIRRVAQNGTISTIAGTGTRGFGGDGGAATSAVIGFTYSIAIADDGAILIGDSPRIRRIAPDGKISTLAGGGASGLIGDGGQATEAGLSAPRGIAVMGDGGILIVESGTFRVRRVAPDGIISTVAGIGTRRVYGDGGEATEAGLSFPYNVAIAPDGAILIADSFNRRIRRIAPDGSISTVAGGGERSNGVGDGGPAVDAVLLFPTDIAVARDGTIVIADTGDHRVRRVAPDGIITTVAGSGEGGFGGDGGDATLALLRSPYAVAVEADGAILIADSGNNRIRRLATDGTISTVAGSAASGFGGDGGQAIAARLDFPSGVAVTLDGSILIADSYNNRIRRVDTNGRISTVAGTGETGFSGNGGAAVSADLNSPSALAVTPDGSIFFADWGNSMVRRIAPNGTISTVAGTGDRGFAGDNGPATAALLNLINGVAVFPDGSIVIADTDNSRIRKVTFTPAASSPAMATKK
jgi:trimeric autotransporter adhesin